MTRPRLLAGALALAIAVVAGAGCEPEKAPPKGVEGGTPAPQDSKVDKNPPPAPRPPGGGGAPIPPPKKGGGAPMGG